MFIHINVYGPILSNDLHLDICYQGYDSEWPSTGFNSLFIKKLFKKKNFKNNVFFLLYTTKFSAHYLYKIDFLLQKQKFFLKMSFSHIIFVIAHDFSRCIIE